MTEPEKVIDGTALEKTFSLYMNILEMNTRNPVNFDRKKIW